MWSRKTLTQAELEAKMKSIIEGEYSDSNSDLYEPSSSETSSEEGTKDENKAENNDEEYSTDDESESNGNESPTEILDTSEVHNMPSTSSLIVWSKPEQSFVPKKQITDRRPCILDESLSKNSSPMQILHKVFPRSLYTYIAQCTNERIQLYKQAKNNRNHLKETDKGEVQAVIGCMFIMSYNRLPSVSHYWSTHNSLGNEAIKSAISRDRYKLISSKMYFASPEKPENCSKTYYIDDLVNCLKKTFMRCRQDSSHQSIDESMTKFKGRSSMKQYMPLKPTKRGIKMWLRCDANTGYTYDFNIYIQVVSCSQQPAH